MDVGIELLKQGKTRELWDRCCGFIDLSINDFMKIQSELLLEQIELLKKCELGKKIMHGAQPGSIEEFRQQVPITTYSDYAPYLLEKREDVLPEKPIMWLWTSGRSGEYPHKWAPFSKRQYDELGDIFLGQLLLATCRDRGDVAIEENDTFFYGYAPPPYCSGACMRRLDDMDSFRIFPPIKEAEEMSFEKRVEQGIKAGLLEGIDVMPAITSVLVAIGERFSQGGGMSRIGAAFKKPKMLPRLLKAVVKSKLAGRPMLPRDIWTIKGLLAGGTDNGVYREKIKNMWGRYPLDVYGITEGIMLATQTWDFDTMTFFPQLNLLEFMPEKEWNNWLMDKTYKAELLWLDEVKAGEKYALVITNFRGGAFVRYFIGDVVKITSLRNEKLNINLPQMVFESRIDGIIDIAGFTRLTEKVIWRALENSGVPYNDWAVRKEATENQPVLHLYIEPKQASELDEISISDTVHRHLSLLDNDYALLENMLNLKPLKVTILPQGTFQAYIEKQRAAGADLAHLKPPHVNPTEGQLSTLLTLVH